MYLLDTNVISELRKVKTGKADPNVAAWIHGVSSSSLWISVISILEIEIGILRLERRDQVQAAIFRAWLEDRVVPSFAGQRTLAVDTVVARRCANLHVPDPRSERDALIAASALVHGLTVVTRNIADFEPLGVPLLDPWA